MLVQSSEFSPVHTALAPAQTWRGLGANLHLESAGPPSREHDQEMWSPTMILRVILQYRAVTTFIQLFSIVRSFLHENWLFGGSCHHKVKSSNTLRSYTKNARILPLTAYITVNIAVGNKYANNFWVFAANVETERD